MSKRTPEEIALDNEAKEKYKGRYFYKLVFGLAGWKIIRVDKVERTLKFKKIRKELEHKISERYQGKREKYYDCDPSLGGLPDYAFACDHYVFYFIYKRKILKEEYGIEYLDFLMLNPNR
jgi:hypothetical protein